MAAAPVLLALALVAGGNRALHDNLTASDSGTRLRAAYALAHLHDPASPSEVESVRRLLLTGSPDEQNAAAQGIWHRRWPLGIPTELVNAVWHPTIRRPDPPPFVISGMGAVPPLQDPLLLLPSDKAREILRREAGSTHEGIEARLRREDAEWQRTEAKRTGEWDRRRIALMRRPSFRPPCLEDCIQDLMWSAWVGMDMAPILELRRPKTNETDWWTAILFDLVRAAGGDETTLGSLAARQPRLADAGARRALLVWLVNLPPGVTIAERIRPIVVAAVSDRDPDIRRYAVELLAARPELHGVAGAPSSLAGALRNTNPDVRVRAACALWDLGPLDGSVQAAVAARLGEEADPVVQAVLRAALERGATR